MRGAVRVTARSSNMLYNGFRQLMKNVKDNDATELQGLNAPHITKSAANIVRDLFKMDKIFGQIKKVDDRFSKLLKFASMDTQAKKHIVKDDKEKMSLLQQALGPLNRYLLYVNELIVCINNLVQALWTEDAFIDKLKNHLLLQLQDTSFENVTDAVKKRMSAFLNAPASDTSLKLSECEEEISEFIQSYNDVRNINENIQIWLKKACFIQKRYKHDDTSIAQHERVVKFIWSHAMTDIKGKINQRTDIKNPVIENSSDDNSNDKQETSVPSAFRVGLKMMGNVDAKNVLVTSVMNTLVPIFMILHLGLIDPQDIKCANDDYKKTKTFTTLKKYFGSVSKQSVQKKFPVQALLNVFNQEYNILNHNSETLIQCFDTLHFNLVRIQCWMQTPHVGKVTVDGYEFGLQLSHAHYSEPMDFSNLRAMAKHRRQRMKSNNEFHTGRKVALGKTKADSEMNEKKNQNRKVLMTFLRQQKQFGVGVLQCQEVIFDQQKMQMCSAEEIRREDQCRCALDQLCQSTNYLTSLMKHNFGNASAPKDEAKEQKGTTSAMQKETNEPFGNIEDLAVKTDAKVDKEKKPDKIQEKLNTFVNNFNKSKNLFDKMAVIMQWCMYVKEQMQVLLKKLNPLPKQAQQKRFISLLSDFCWPINASNFNKNLDWLDPLVEIIFCVVCPVYLFVDLFAFVIQ